MKLLVCVLVATASVVFAQETQPTTRPDGPAVRFQPIDIVVDAKAGRLAAYQFELTATRGTIAIVGVEGGEHAAFAKPPYYDPAALAKDRIVIAAFSTGKDLPTGRTRIARVHLQITGPVEPQYALKLHVAAGPDAKTIPATINIAQGAR